MGIYNNYNNNLWLFLLVILFLLSSNMIRQNSGVSMFLFFEPLKQIYAFSDIRYFVFMALQG